jgi:hypothetical protein
MQAEKSCDYNDHDHYANNIKNIHFLAPIKATLGPGYAVNETRPVTKNLDCDQSIRRRRQTAVPIRR